MNLYKEKVKYWAKNDELKLSDTKGVDAPNTDPFKTFTRDLKSKSVVYKKVNHTEQGIKTDIIGDPEFKSKWKAKLKWS